MNDDQPKAERAIWHGWLLHILDESQSTEVRREVASLLCLSGLEWANDGPEHLEFLNRLCDAESKEADGEVRLQLGLAIEALDPEIKRRRA